MRRRVESDAMTLARQRRRDERRHAPLAVGAADVDGGENLVRIAQCREEAPGGVEAELDGGEAGVEIIQGALVPLGHAQVWNRGQVASASGCALWRCM